MSWSSPTGSFTKPTRAIRLARWSAMPASSRRRRARRRQLFPSAQITVADCPLQRADWPLLLQQSGLTGPMRELHQEFGDRIAWRDLRKEVYTYRDGQLVLVEDAPHGDPLGYVEVKLGLVEPPRRNFRSCRSVRDSRSRSPQDPREPPQGRSPLLRQPHLPRRGPGHQRPEMEDAFQVRTDRRVEEPGRHQRRQGIPAALQQGRAEMGWRRVLGQRPVHLLDAEHAARILPRPALGLPNGPSALAGLQGGAQRRAERARGASGRFLCGRRQLVRQRNDLADDLRPQHGVAARRSRGRAASRRAAPLFLCRRRIDLRRRRRAAVSEAARGGLAGVWHRPVRD